MRYEDLVAKPQQQLTPLFEFLGLKSHDWTKEFRYEVGGETSNSPSYQQVVQPPHTRSIDRWRHYSQHLESSLAILQPWVRRFGYQ